MTARRIWGALLVVGVVAAVPLLLWWGREQWFFLDEWTFFVDRRLTDVPSLLAPHNGHWVTLPAVAYRLLYRAFGLRSYAPFQLLAVLGHVGVVVMAWFTMRRLRVRPAIATISALLFVFYGAGRQDIQFGFQVALTGAVAFGLAALLVATADESTTRRDVLSLGLGLAAIMCSAIGIPMVMGVALAVLIRRGARAAILYAVPLAVVYCAWYLAYARGETHWAYSLGPETLSFVWRMLEAAFRGLGQSPLIGAALACVAAVGVVWALQDARLGRRTQRLAIVTALLVSALVFAVLTAFGRAELGVGTASSERYVYVVAALVLPVVALGVEALARRWLVLGAAALVLLALGLPRNIDLLRHPDPFTLGAKALVTAAAHSPLIDQLSPETRLFSFAAAPSAAPTAALLRSLASDGRLPALDHIPPRTRLDAERVVALHQTGPRRSRPCPVTSLAPSFRAARGTRVVFSGTITVVLRNGSATSSPASYSSDHGNAIQVRAGPVDLTIAGVLGRPPAICRIVRP